MSRLIQLLRQIQAAETIKKTTNAMRLIAMTNHMRLRQNTQEVEAYKIKLEEWLSTITDLGRSVPRVPDTAPTPKKTLYVVVGSQKGLCGMFNVQLATFAKKEMTGTFPPDVLIIGKHMRDTLRYQGVEPIIAHDEFNTKSLFAIASNIAQLILAPTYKYVRLFYTKPKTFFVHERESHIFYRSTYMTTCANPDANPYNWEQPFQETFNAVANLTLKAQLEYMFMSSLLAEAASRFLSMDSATRNADDLISSMRIDYNKLRQTAITRELIDLSGSFMSDVVS